MQQKNLVACSICKREMPKSKCVPNHALRPAMALQLRKEIPEWNPNGFICQQDLNRLRAEHVQRMLVSGKGSLSHLEADVEQSFKDDQIISRKLMEESREVYTFGQRMADHMATFGGSWKFLLAFFAFFAVWIGANVILEGLHLKAFDAFPFSFLNVILSCLAAMQAPIIMMSQNRQESRDRKRAENDYKVNLKAELEIRNLHEKFDHLLEHQWQYLMDIQQIQVELMEEMVERKRK